MENELNYRKVLLLAVGSGIITSILIVPFLVKINFSGKVQEKKVFIPQSDYFSEAVTRVKNSVVAIQSFNQGQLIRTGSGIIMTQDGLIFTLNNIVPPEATITQVINSNKVETARVVFRNYKTNIAIISVVDSDLRVISLNNNLPELAQNLMIFSKVIDFGKDQALINEVLVSQVNEDKGTFKITSPYDQNIFGSALINNNGDLLGMVDFKNLKTTIVSAQEITNDLNTYLAKIKNLKP